MGETRAVQYDGFISYSHAADGLLAPRLSSGLQRFAKPWWRRRALRIFRDESSLTASPHLWDSIAAALDASEWFILLLSPEAAASPWVNREIEYWVESHSVDRILPVVTGGIMAWDGQRLAGSAVPPTLAKLFKAEPRWVDLRFAQEEEHLDLNNPRFLSAVADIASAIRGVPKEDLESEEVRQHRRTRRTAGLAVALIGVLAIAASLASVLASRNAATAEEQRRIAESNASDARARLLAISAIDSPGDRDPDLTKLLGLEALRTGSLGESRDDVLLRLADAVLTNPSVETTRLADDIRASGPMVLSATKTNPLLFAAWGGENKVYRLTAAGKPVWSRSIEGEVQLVSVASDDGERFVAVGASGADGRVVVLDAENGAVVAEFDIPECAIPADLGWSPTGAWLAWGSGPLICSNADSRHWIEVAAADGWEERAVVGVDSANPKPGFDGEGNLIVLQPYLPATVYSPPSFEDPSLLPLIGSGIVAPDGSTFVLSRILPEEPDRIRVFDASGEQRQHVTIPSDTSLEGAYLGADGWLALRQSNRDAWMIDAVEGRPSFSVPIGSAASLILDLESEHLITSHRDGSVKVWDLSVILAFDRAGPGFEETEEFLEVVRSSLSRTFTPEECDFFQIEPCPTLAEVRSR